MSPKLIDIILAPKMVFFTRLKRISRWQMDSRAKNWILIKRRTQKREEKKKRGKN